MKFVDELPTNESTKGAHTDLVALRAHPGSWGEVASYELRRGNSAYSRGSGLCRKHPDLEYAVRRVGEKYVLFVRAVAQ